MRCTIPEISWHNRDPVLSIDLQIRKNNATDKIQRLATGGTDSHVLIWYITIEPNGDATIEFAADLTRHQKAVNVVRFSPSGELLASGDDEAAIIVWKLQCEDGSKQEQWNTLKVLRGHVEDVYDLAWSPDSSSIISGSVDNTAILWDVKKGLKTEILTDHKGFVQGVTWNPVTAAVATLGSDRTLRLFSTASGKCAARTQRSALFHDDTFKSFFRRLNFTPDGLLLVAPSGLLEDAEGTYNATHVFTHLSLTKPSVSLPSLENFTVAVRCCPLLFQLRDGPCLMFDLPYRMVLAVAEQKSVVLYDTQQLEPFAMISNIHYTRLTDLTWSSDGRLLIISSTDGYCSIVTFSADELGVVFTPDVQPTQGDELKAEESDPVSDVKQENVLPGEETHSTEVKQRIETVTDPVSNVKQENVPEHSTEVKHCFETVTDPVSNVKQEKELPDIKPGDVKQSGKAGNCDENVTEVEEIMETETDCKNNCPTNDDIDMKSTIEDVDLFLTETLDVELVESSEKKEEEAKEDAVLEEKKDGVTTPVTPVQVTRAPRRVALTTLASPKSKKRLV